MSATKVTQVPQVVQTEPYVMARLEEIQGSASCQLLPKGITLLIYSFDLGIAPRDLFGRVQFFFPQETGGIGTGIQIFFAYDRIEKIFTEQLRIGAEGGNLEGVQANLRAVANTKYRYFERVPRGITCFDAWEKGEILSWQLRLWEAIEADIPSATDVSRHSELEQPGRTTMGRVETYGHRTPNLTLEEACAYAPQVKNMINVRRIRDELFQDHSNELLQFPCINLFSSPELMAQAAKSEPKSSEVISRELIQFVPMSPNDPNMPKFAQECLAQAGAAQGDANKTS